MSDEESAAFNAFTANWIARIDSMTKSIFLISGGAMTLTIGAFLNSSSLSLNIEAVYLIRWSWYLLSASLACSILLSYILVVSGGIVLKNWEKQINIETDGRVIINSPVLLRFFAWVLGTVSVICCLLGFIFIAVGASFLL